MQTSSSKHDQVSTNKRKSVIPTRRTRELDASDPVVDPQNQPVFPGKVPSFLKTETDYDDDVSSGSGDPLGMQWNEEKMFNLAGSEGSPSVGIEDVSQPELARLNAGPSSLTESTDVTASGGKNYMKTPQIDGLLVSRGEGRYEKLIRCDTCGKVCRTSNMARHKRRYCTGVPGLSPRKRGRPWIKGGGPTGVNSGMVSETDFDKNTNADSYGNLDQSSGFTYEKMGNDDNVGKSEEGESFDDMGNIVIKQEPATYEGEFGQSSS